MPSGKFPPAFLSSAEFFQNQLIGEILSRIPSECQTDWIQISPDILSDLIWIQTVFKSYQRTTLGDKEFKSGISSRAGSNFICMYMLMLEGAQWLSSAQFEIIVIVFIGVFS